MADKKKELQQYDQIGGMLWLPAIWTVTNLLIAVYMLTYAPAAGGVLIAISMLNAYLFWSRKKIYRWFFPVQSIASLLVMVISFGPNGIGGGSAWTIIFIFYMLLSKRSRGTFTQPLFKSRQLHPTD